MATKKSSATPEKKSVALATKDGTILVDTISDTITDLISKVDYGNVDIGSALCLSDLIEMLYTQELKFVNVSVSYKIVDP